MKLSFDTDTNLSTEHHLDMLAIEGEALSNLITVFRNSIPDFATAIKASSASISSLFDSNKKTIDELSKDQKLAVLAANHVDWLNYGTRSVAVPENFKGTLSDYAGTLLYVSKELYQISTAAMADYSTILATFISNKDDKLALKDHTAFYKRLSARREELNNKLAAFTKAHAPGATSIRSVIPRASDLEPLIRSAIQLDKENSVDRLKDFRDSINKSSDLLDIIIERAKDGDIEKISPAAAMNISKGAYEVAKIAEFYGVVYYDITALCTVVNGIVGNLIEREAK